MVTKILKKMEILKGFIQIPAKGRCELIADIHLPTQTQLNGKPARLDKYGRLWSLYLKNKFSMGTEVELIKTEKGFQVVPILNTEIISEVNQQTIASASVPKSSRAEAYRALKGNSLKLTSSFEFVTPETSLETLDLNWREKDLPEKLRTKHVHRLHPYLGKFIPQLVEVFLRKYSPKHVTDPFCGSGTTLVEANVLGIDSLGCDISAFNCLLSKVKTDRYDVIELESQMKHILRRLRGKASIYPSFKHVPDTSNEYLNNWYAPKARRQLLYFLSLIPEYKYQDLLKVILSRSARSARLTTHYDLDFPKKPQTEPYYCYKHRRICKPTNDALQFLRRYCIDSVKRIKEFSKIRTNSKVEIINTDSREYDFPKTDMVFTSPPYVGLIDYHRQHDYAYELLGIERKEELEIGPAFKGKSKKAQKEYITNIGKVFANIRKSLNENGVVAIVVNDRNKLYRNLAPKIGFVQEKSIKRQVNRRTGRRANDFYEEVLIWRKDDETRN